ncbi:hypothetical protein KSP35_15825 [Aquihabitans sp. G128]|uniref:hypothetical protein n=1 Tax=Aquihabitans sp. G128 TaxID=2849779 RepID=UPI001C24F0CD|nr:hypothetical protein [Aquihabitans sp. G128]QXC59836.1 hypothetical protein KSP35_15825 [Aquihabitans sp. G128]
MLAESRYRVRSTAVSGVGLLLTVGAGGFLALWWGRHWVRTRRKAQGRHGRSGPGTSGDLPDTDFVEEAAGPAPAPSP